ncbi:hypothetical protein LCGC14_2590440 [marine sediment metagenome]|uniref:Uncharacterized protein n=1 Tax=marine sediment metagenome TaxID=412755 RepID=A0A0F9CMV5_9ZZZZ
MSRCFGCHLERNLGAVPVQGSPAGQVLCPRCSKQIDQSIGILEALGFVVNHGSQLVMADDPEPPKSPETKRREASKVQTP